MANSSEILEHILGDSSERPKNITYQWLLPNIKGLNNYFAVLESSKSSAASTYPTPPPTPTSDDSPSFTVPPEAPKHEVSIFLAATESFSMKNTNCTIAESLDRFRPLIRQSLDGGTFVRAYISVALGCPYEGLEVDPHKVAELAASLLEMGANEISVADTTGMGTAPRTLKLLQTLTAAGIQNEDLAFHFHDTYGQALVNTVVALEHGIRTFDSAVGGLGGCPFSPGATGNVATEDLVHCIHGLGADTGLDVVKLAEIGEWISGEIGRVNESRAGKATLAKLRAG